jgi:hypothetical protein
MNLWRLSQHQLHAAQARQVAQIAAEVEPDQTLKRVTPGSLPGDEKALRGIPAIGRGVSGCINGTRPGSNLR